MKTEVLIDVALAPESSYEIPRIEASLLLFLLVFLLGSLLRPRHLRVSIHKSAILKLNYKRGLPSSII